MGAMGAGAGERPSWDVRIVRGGDGLPLRKQAAQYAQARVLVLGHGAGMVHALWMMRMRRTKGNSSTLRNQSRGNDTDDDIENEDDDVHNNKNDDDQVGHLSSSSPTVIEVGTAEDLKHDYLARITALFGSSGGDDSAENSHQSTGRSPRKSVMGGNRKSIFGGA